MNSSKESNHVPVETINGDLTERERKLAEEIEKIYSLFGVKIEGLSGIMPGPRVTRFSYRVPSDTKVAKITRLRDDVSLALSVPKVRIVCPLPGEMAFGIEVPNREEKPVDFDEVFASEAFAKSQDKLCVVLGKALGNEPVCLELSKTPHVLIGGQPGSGKTTVLHNMIVSLICSAKPSEVKLLLIDPKQYAFDAFKDAAHLLQPIIYDAQDAIDSLKRLREECDRRHQLLRSHSAREINAYNAAAEEPMCRIVAIVDEMAFLACRDLREFELAVCCIAQAGRAVGIHLVLATNDLTAQTCTGLIKAVIPTRIALSTGTALASRSIMDKGDAECLLGKGDMLLCDLMMNPPRRIQAPRLSAEQIQEKLSGALR